MTPKTSPPRYFAPTTAAMLRRAPAVWCEQWVNAQHYRGDPHFDPHGLGAKGEDDCPAWFVDATFDPSALLIGLSALVGALIGTLRTIEENLPLGAAALGCSLRMGMGDSLDEFASLKAR